MPHVNFVYCFQQLQASLAPKSADPQGSWNECKLNHAHCNLSQIQFLQGDLISIFFLVFIFSMQGMN